MLICHSNITLPCSIGDEAYAIRKVGGKPKVCKGKISEMFFIEGMKLCIVVKGISRGEWGKAIFPSYEEAQKYLEGGGIYED